MKTARLNIRPANKDDVENIKECFRTFDAKEFCHYAEDTDAFAEELIESGMDVFEHNGQIIGGVLSEPFEEGHFLDPVPTTNFAYWCRGDYQNQGFTTEALNAIIPTKTGKKVIPVYLGNGASNRVAQKVGLKFERVVLGVGGEANLYSDKV